MKPPAPSPTISEALVLKAAKASLRVELGGAKVRWLSIPASRRRERKDAARASLMVLAAALRR
jgi:hypothetical protein